MCFPCRNQVIDYYYYTKKSMKGFHHKDYEMISLHFIFLFHHFITEV